METQRKKKGSESLPVEVMMDILKRLPIKTLIRFLCLSKLWASKIRSRYFMKLFLNQSLTRPKRLVFVFRTKALGLPYTSVHLKKTHESSSCSDSSAFPDSYYVTCHTRQRQAIAPSVHGLICYGPVSRLVVYNPCTRRSLTLPKFDVGRRPISNYLGYDPIDNVYKVFCIVRGMRILRNRHGLAEQIRVLTLGTQHSWRLFPDTIPPHSPQSQELCINGVLYYRASIGTKQNDSAIMRFDVRSEKLDLIKGPCKFRSCSMLTSYEGKLSVIFFEKRVSGIIRLWVLEDASKEEWSKKIYDLPAPAKDAHFKRFQRFCATDAESGEIIFTPMYVHESLAGAVYFNLKKNSVRTFEIQGATDKYISCPANSVSCQIDSLMFL